MKKKIITALLALTLILGLTGCEMTPNQFTGEWHGVLTTLQINDDYTWVYGQLPWVFDRGTWVFNGDETITLISNDGTESIATKGYDNFGEQKHYLYWRNRYFYEPEKEDSTD